MTDHNLATGRLPAGRARRAVVLKSRGRTSAPAVIEVGSIWLIAWCLPLNSAGRDLLRTEDRQLQQARTRAVSLCVKLGCRGPVSIRVEAPVNMPAGILAHTTKWGDACVLTFTKQTLMDASVMAHEACHCALDYDVVGEYGYLPHVDKEEQTVREAATKACARKIIRRD